jgi:prepilin-type processing-associated H-X9-DG protein
MIEVNCVSNKVPPPHPAGYNILFADGHVVSSRQLPSSITSKQKASIEGLLRQAGPVRSLALAK